MKTSGASIRLLGILLIVFILLVLFYESWEQLMPVRRIPVSRSSLLVLTLQHMGISLCSAFISIAFGLGLGLLVYSGILKDFKSLLLHLAAAGENFPSVAILALAVPILGYGFLPALLALSIYGVLPVLRGTILGMEFVAREIKEAAASMGMSRSQILFRVVLPLSLPSIINGIRVTLVITISAATLGALVGSGGLGVPIISGIRTFDPYTIMKGAIPVTLLAFIADTGLKILETHLIKS